MADIAVSQITGIVVINVLLAILSIVFLPIIMNMFPAAYDPNKPNKQSVSNEVNQEQQMVNEGYYANGNNYASAPYTSTYYSYPQTQGQPQYQAQPQYQVQPQYQPQMQAPPQYQSQMQAPPVYVTYQ